MIDPNDVSAPHKVKPYPWRICARAVGQAISLKTWPTAEAEPTWTDPSYTAMTTAADPVWEGRAGWYAGHVGLGGTGWIDYTDLTTGPASPDSQH